MGRNPLKLGILGQELVDILGYPLTLAFFDFIKENGDIKTPVLFVFAPNDYAVTIDINGFYPST
jgi:hypothetical protein